MAIREIYKTSDGIRVPSVTTVLSRFKDSGGLLYWASQAGLDGKTLDEARAPAATAGTMAHDLVEAHINKRELPELHGDRDVIAKARAAFEAFLRWQDMTKLAIRHTEVSLVSEKHKFGGRLDAIGVLANDLCLLDWKSWSCFLSPGAIVAFHDTGWAEGVQRVISSEVASRAKKQGRLPNLYWAWV